MNYKISVEYQISEDEAFTAIVTVWLPTKSEKADSLIASEYRSSDHKIAGETLDLLWGSYNLKGYRFSYPIEIKADSLLELKTLVDRKLIGIQDVIREVYQASTTLPPSFKIEVDPTNPVSIDTTDSRSVSIDEGTATVFGKRFGAVLDAWQKGLRKGDKIAVWSKGSLEHGTIDAVNRDGIYDFYIELDQQECFQHEAQTLFLCLHGSDVLPDCCTSRSDSWRFELNVGDLIGWRDGDTSRSGYIRDLKYNTSIGEIEIIWHGETNWNNYDCMQLFQV